MDLMQSDREGQVLLNDLDDIAKRKSLLPHFLFAQSTAPFIVSAHLTAENFGSVHKSYIRAAADKVLSPKLQDKMITSWHIDKVFSLNSGHFPMNTVAGELAKTIKLASSKY